MKIAIAIVQFIVVLSLSASFVYAADFTFEVPVELRNVHPDFNQGNVFCELRDGSGLAMGPVGSYRFPIVGGNYTGSVIVEISTIDASRARRYRCELALTRSVATGTREGDLLEAAVVSRYGRNATAPSVWQVQGDIPSPTPGR